MTFYRSVVFEQGEEADRLIEEFQYMRSWDFIDFIQDAYGEVADTAPQLEEPWGADDDTYRMRDGDSEWVVSINWGIPYIGVTRVDRETTTQ